MSNEAITIRGSQAIRCAQLRAQLGALKLEMRGMTRRGQSMSAMLKAHFGMNPRAGRAAVMTRLLQEIEVAEAALIRHGQNGEPSQ